MLISLRKLCSVSPGALAEWVHHTEVSHGGGVIKRGEGGGEKRELTRGRGQEGEREGIGFKLGSFTAYPKAYQC